MERRHFLHRAAGLTAAAILPSAGISIENSAGMLIADPHAHPHQFFGSRTFDPSTPTLDSMQQVGMILCAFAAVGDMTYQRGRFGTAYVDTRSQLDYVSRLEESGRIRIVRTNADLQSLIMSRDKLGGLMAIEGADALAGDLKNLDAFHAQGVRMVTLLHDRDNELGFNQRSNADGPLTAFGMEAVERMNTLGMLIDVAHANTATLQSIVAASKQPVIDSHTSLVLPDEDRQPSRRLRTWQEMEWVAKAGGVICTWPFAYSGARSARTTLRHWAEEIVLMKTRLGIEHCGLGTDGGGGLPRLVKGWRSIADLPALVDAMSEAGLSRADIAAYVGGNFLRLLGRCLA
jgi:microsomal dipeptidase-like Zn-dependent dipeptidase